MGATCSIIISVTVLNEHLAAPAHYFPDLIAVCGFMDRQHGGCCMIGHEKFLSFKERNDRADILELFRPDRPKVHVQNHDVCRFTNFNRSDSVIKIQRPGTIDGGSFYRLVECEHFVPGFQRTDK